MFVFPFNMYNSKTLAYCKLDVYPKLGYYNNTIRYGARITRQRKTR
jgi:hypothetical protein